MWLWENWLLVALAATVLTAYVIGGWRLALGIATLGVGVLLYRQGYVDADRQHNERAEKLDQERADAYREIDKRNTSGNDAVERLRKGDY